MLSKHNIHNTIPYYIFSIYPGMNMWIMGGSTGCLKIVNLVWGISRFIRKLDQVFRQLR